MKKRAMGLLLLALFVMPIHAAATEKTTVPAELDRDIRKLMAVTGVENLATQVTSQMRVALEKAMPQVPMEAWDRMEEKMDTGELIDMTVPIYAKHFTHDEIQQMLEFYATPLGRKMVTTMPALMQELMVAGQEWGEKIGEEIHDELAAEGYE